MGVQYIFTMMQLQSCRVYKRYTQAEKVVLKSILFVNFVSEGEKSWYITDISHFRLALCNSHGVALRERTVKQREPGLLFGVWQCGGIRRARD